MKQGKYFSVPYDILHDPRIELMNDRKESLEPLGVWIGLLTKLYYKDGFIDLNEQGQKALLMRELKLDESSFDWYLQEFASCNFIERDLLEIGHVVSHGVCDELEYRKCKSDAGKKGGKTSKKAKR